MRSLILCALLAVAQPIAAWGDVGHRTVGYLAQKYFTEQASQWVTTMLANENGYDVSDAAVWADAVKFRRHYSAEWHYIGTYLCCQQMCIEQSANDDQMQRMARLHLAVLTSSGTVQEAA